MTFNDAVQFIGSDEGYAAGYACGVVLSTAMVAIFCAIDGPIDALKWALCIALFSLFWPVLAFAPVVLCVWLILWIATKLRRPRFVQL